MHKEWLNLDSFMVTGITTRTCNSDEIIVGQAKIAALMANYWACNLAAAINDRITPNNTYSVYTDYDTDEHGEYTYLLGERVDSMQHQDQSRFQSRVIPAGRYLKLTTEAGTMPQIIIGAWQAIWHMTPSELQGTRSYLADFEVYDQRACDPAKAIVDIYIGLKD